MKTTLSGRFVCMYFNPKPDAGSCFVNMEFIVTFVLGAFYPVPDHEGFYRIDYECIDADGNSDIDHVAYMLKSDVSRLLNY